MSFDPAATRRIGQRDVDVSVLGVGTAPFGSAAREDSDASIATAFSRLYDSGVRYFDTARSYGSEPMIGRWLKAMPGARKVLRPRLPTRPTGTK